MKLDLDLTHAHNRITVLLKRIEAVEAVAAINVANIATLSADSHKRIEALEDGIRRQSHHILEFNSLRKQAERKLSEQQTKFHKRLDKMEVFVARITKAWGVLTNGDG